MSEKVGFTKYCIICGVPFTTSTGKGKYCPTCRKIQQRQQNRNNNRARYEENKIAKEQSKPRKKKTLTDFMWELKEYNDKHHTKLSYGEYVALLSGYIKRGGI